MLAAAALAVATLAVATLATVAAAASIDPTVAASVPVQVVRVRQFDFAAGRTSPVKLGFRTLGTPHRGADGRIDNAVVLLHDTGGSGAAFLGRDAPLLYGPGAPFDLKTTFVVLPDAIGAGGSSKPSDGLGVSFPHYDYGDVVHGVRAVLADLKVGRVRAVVGVAMGAMVGWTWAEADPDEIGTLVAIGGAPVAVTGRDLLWRLGARDALLASPTAGGSGARAAAAITLVGTVPADRLAAIAPDVATAQTVLDARALAAGDPVDLAFALDAVRAYAPQAKLDAVRAKVVVVDFADSVAPAEPPLPPRFRRIVVPASATARSQAMPGDPGVWLPYVAPVLTGGN